MNVRLARIEDADRIASIHVRSWQWAYRDIIPGDVLAAISVEGRAQSWKAQLAGDTVRVLVAESENQICGWAAFGLSRDADASYAAEVYAIYLEQHSVRRGIGRMLWSTALKLLLAEGYDCLFVWVLEANAAARRFYESMGGETDGTTKTIQLGSVELEEVRYRCPINVPDRNI